MSYNDTMITVHVLRHAFNVLLVYLSPDSPEGAAEELAASPPTESENATCVVPVTVDAAPELLLLVE